MFSFVGDTVLDPFLGTGTTTLAAMDAGRNSIGIEIDPLYLRTVRQRLLRHRRPADADIALIDASGQPESLNSRPLFPEHRPEHGPKQRKSIRGSKRSSASSGGKGSNEPKVVQIAWPGFDDMPTSALAANGK